MFEYDGIQYELKMNTNRVKMVEAATKSSLIGEWFNNNGALSLTTVETCFQLCLKEVGSDTYCKQKEGLEVCHGYMEEHGYASCAVLIQEALQGDMPFLFQAN